MAYKTSIEVAVKGANDLAHLKNKIQDSAKAVDSLNVFLKAFSTNSEGVVRSINNLNSVASLAVKNFNEVALGTDEATVAARRYIDANKELNKGLKERANLVAKIKESDRVAGLARAGIRERTQYGGSIGPGQASALERIPDFGMGRQAGQSVPVGERIQRSIQAQQDELRLQKALERMELKKTNQINKQLDFRAKNLKMLKEEVAKGQIILKLREQRKVGSGFRDFSINAERFGAPSSPIMQGPQVSSAYQESFLEEKRRQRRLDRQLRVSRGRERQQRYERAGASAMIGGAFPLLFGQGAGAAAGGALGGFMGGLKGGQFGFALSLVGTNLGSLLDRLVQGASELGKAMGPFAQDTKAVTEAMGMQGSVQEARLNLIEQTKGKTAAFNAAMKIMALEVGDRGVQALQQFGESARLMGGAFALLGTRLQALAAGFGNFILQITGVKNALEKGEARQIVRFSALQGNEEAQGLVQRRESLGQVTGSRKRFLTDKTQELTLDEKLFAIRQKIRTEADILTASTDALLKDKKEEVAANERIKELMSEGINKELAKELAGIEQKFSKTQEYLELKAVEAELAFRTAISEGKSEEEIERRRNALLEIAKILGENNTKLAEALGLTKSLTDETGKTEVKWEDIKEKIASGLTSAIQGLIDGTKSLGESLAGIAKSIASMYLKAAITNILPMAEGGYVSNGIKPFSSGGMVTRPTLGLVGEAGEDEYIIPASKMASSMQRYSAGARGEAVIPGTGSSYAGSGGSSTTVNYSGPILNFNSEEFVPKSAVGQIIATATARGAAVGESRTISSLRNSRSRRSSLGL